MGYASMGGVNVTHRCSFQNLTYFTAFPYNIFQRVRVKFYCKPEHAQSKVNFAEQYEDGCHSTLPKDGKDKKMICHFCGEDDHIATTGPGYSKVIQYFACKKFVEMTPSQRCAELFRKGLCI